MPRFAVATTADAALAALDRIGLPAVVKPSDRTGSLGVAKLDGSGAHMLFTDMRALTGITLVD